MPPSRTSAAAPAAAAEPADNTPYTLALLSEYTHTLDTLPLELSRNFADLRELDAVLSSSMASLTTKINKLTRMIEENKEDKQDRLWLLADIAEEAARLKLGGDDKIRVACQAADNLKYNISHLRNLAEHIPNFDPSTLDRKTTYPHVSARSFMPVLPPENTRRRRGGYGSLLTSAPDPSPAKKRQRVLQHDDLDIMRSPKKDKNELNPRSRARAKKTDRLASPSESLVSVTSHVLPQTNGNSSYRGAASAASARGNNPATGSKRSRPSAGNRSATPHAGDPYDQNGMHPNGHSGNSRRDAYGVPQSSHHTALPHPYQNGAVPNGTHHHPGTYNIHAMSQNIPGAQDWNPPLAQQLEGPGMPVSRGVTMPIIPVNTTIGPGIPGDAGDTGDGEGDGDDRRYCICNGISYGEMIACDDSQCEREWVCLFLLGIAIIDQLIVLGSFIWLASALSSLLTAAGFVMLAASNEIRNVLGAAENGERAVEGRGRVLHDTYSH
ncbi:hypothetical protein C0993_005735 [Termitomyces sp. T159_Od127]|nr:hypothetical protein C0993_005735 [Termitomyces sp. T159_Od127]